MQPIHIKRPEDIQTRISKQPVSLELARFKNINEYSPKIGDFVIWHGWFRHWFGVISDPNPERLSIIVENLPKLLLTAPESERNKLIRYVPLDKIKSSFGGEYAVMQDGVWFVD